MGLVSKAWMTPMIVCLVLTLSGSGLRGQGNSSTETGKVYDLKQKNKVLFLFERQVEGPPDKQHVVVRFLSPSRKELVHEEVDYEGRRFREYTVDKFQTGEHAEVLVDSGKIQFLYKDRERQEKRNTETWSASVIVIDELPWFIRQNWQSLKAGRSVPFRFVVPDRAETVGFELSPRGAATCGGAPALRVRMKVRSTFARLFAPEIQLTVSEKAPQSICEYVGPTAPYDAGLKELTARTVFDVR
jgi:hypothetical protein